MIVIYNGIATIINIILLMSINSREKVYMSKLYYLSVKQLYINLLLKIHVNLVKPIYLDLIKIHGSTNYI